MIHTPGWKDEHGIVHIAGSYGYRHIYTQCGEIVVENDDVTPSGITPEYDVCHEFPTCLMCIGSAVDYLPRFARDPVIRNAWGLSPRFLCLR
jgi:hypothetical protein